MSSCQILQQSIYISASVETVECCIADPILMHRWLNPVLRCEPIGVWSTDLGGQSRFMIQLPLWQPTLKSVVVEREPGLIVWAFEGFFQGRDRWQCQAKGQGTHLLNRFEFEIPNPLVRFGFNTFAAGWTKKDMQAQLQRLKQLAEERESS